MVKFVAILVYLFFHAFVWGCQKNPDRSEPPPLFDSIPVVHAVKPLITEASGIADSKRNAGFLWVHEDGGNPRQLYLLGHDGKVAKTIVLQGVVNRDWEDMALVDNDIFLADIGDNNSAYDSYTIYRFAEPAAATDTVKNIASITFKYADGARDAEAFLVDPDTKDIFIITKRDNPSRIYKISFPYSTSTINMAEYGGALPYAGVVSAALSADGSEIIVKTYTGLQYYTRSDGESLPQALSKSHTALPYQLEPQGEAVNFSHSGKGFFTLSEKGFSNKVELFFYPRK